jgi:hypothetical protein
MSARRLVSLALVLGAVFCPRPAFATFHFMQIEQVIAGVDGSTSSQAIQLRMRSTSQNFVAQGRLIAWDAAGQNPVILDTMKTNVSFGNTGSRVLLATSSFAASLNPPVTPDFILDNPIPDSYIPAGSLTFGDDFGTIYWRVSWGGASYTGDQTGSVTNDLDGNFGPAFADPLPTGSGQALRINKAANALSTNNLADYGITAGSATFTNNAGDAGTVVSLISVPEVSADGIALATPFPNPSRGAMTFLVTVPRAMHVSAGIYNLAGRRVSTVFDGTMAAGRNSYSWDALDVAVGAGVYFVAIDAEGTRKSQRFVVLGKGVRQPEPDSDH